MRRRCGGEEEEAAALLAGRGADFLPVLDNGGGFIFTFTFRHRNECKREVGSDPRAGYIFQRSSVPPRADCVRKLERGGANKRTITYVVARVVHVTIVG